MNKPNITINGISLEEYQRKQKAKKDIKNNKIQYKDTKNFVRCGTNTDINKLNTLKL